MISQVIATFINTINTSFEDDCKKTVKHNDYNFCMLNYYILTLLVLFISPYFLIKAFYNTAKDNFYTALFYIFLFTTLGYFL